VKTTFSLTFIALLFLALVTLPQQATAQDKECEALMKKIDEGVDRVAQTGERIGKVEHMIESFGGTPKGLETAKHALETDKSTLRKDKLTIANLVEKLCECCAGKARTAQQPTPTPGQATSDTLKKVFDSVHIGIGIGGGYSSGHDEHHHGEDRHRTADKVSTDKTKTHTTSPTTTHKTITAGCKCHPCTCSPCTCH
jgi:hypothetical protein